MNHEPDNNPYEGPKTTEIRSAGRKPSALAWVVVALIAVPAAFVGFFFSCLGSVVVFDTFKLRVPDQYGGVWILGIACLGGIASAALVIWIGARIIGGYRRTVDSQTESQS